MLKVEQRQDRFEAQLAEMQQAQVNTTQEVKGIQQEVLNLNTKVTSWQEDSSKKYDEVIHVAMLRQGKGRSSKGKGTNKIQKPPDRVFLIVHFSAWRSPRAMRIALWGSHMLAGSNGTKPLAPPCAPNPRRVINNSRPGRAPERLTLVRSRKRSQTLIKEWKYVLVYHMTPPSRRICPLGPYISNLIFWIVCYLYPGWPGGAAGCKARGQPVCAGLSKQQEE